MTRRLPIIGLLFLTTAAMVAAAPVATAAEGSESLRLTNAEGAVVSVAPPAREAATANTARAFPSSESDVIGSVGLIDREQAGYFWSAARGDSVTETFGGPAKIKRAILNLDVVTNNLNSGAHVDWIVSIDAVDIGQFSVTEGETGPSTERFRFPKITGGAYTVELRVANEVAGGEGSHTLRYAGIGPHSINLKK